MPRGRDPVGSSKLPVRFTKDYICHDVGRSSLGFHLEERWKGRKEPLGSGSFGVVWLQWCTTDRAPGRLRAVKEISKLSFIQDNTDYTRELEALARFSRKKYSPYFVQSFGWYENEHSIFITMEYLKFGDLQKYLGSPFPEQEARDIASQLLGALWFMHKDGFAHRDLKPANIFVVSKGPNWALKIGDFGLSKRVDQGLTAFRTMVGTPHYLAPELVSGRLAGPQNISNTSYTAAVDTWAVGVIVFHTLTGWLPFDGIGHLLSYSKNPDGSVLRSLRNQGISEEGQDFVNRLLCVAPGNRLSAAEALRHEWHESDLVSTRPSQVPNRPDYPTPDGSTRASGRWSALEESEINPFATYTRQLVHQAWDDSDSTLRVPVPNSDLPMTGLTQRQALEGRTGSDQELYSEESHPRQEYPGAPELKDQTRATPSKSEFPSRDKSPLGHKQGDHRRSDSTRSKPGTTDSPGPTVVSDHRKTGRRKKPKPPRSMIAPHSSLVKDSVPYDSSGPSTQAENHQHNEDGDFKSVSKHEKLLDEAVDYMRHMRNADIQADGTNRKRSKILSIVTWPSP